MINRWSSASSSQGANPDLQSIGEQLDVATVLTGNIQRACSRLRVTVRLENTADEVQIWSDHYDHELEDVFAIQDSIARAVIDELQVALLGSTGEDLVPVGTDNFDAYQSYLQGRFYLPKRGAGIAQSIPHFERAVQLDPSYALAHTGVADASSIQGFYGLVPPSEVMDRARQAATRSRT